ncbi:insulinase family protein [Aurantibacter crassamenti]|uniref:M16 family metallopeptidase n=1 Tax=Aurantibacter crassamenti TaxID=1837375 RepID=UPI00193A5449|nr:pitrilysin family protein [Aurantibacter crassamenti]MBM1104844.1 insulinase family protein [Aurantibacter crassamenti]
MKKLIFLIIALCTTASYAQIDRSVQPKPGPAPEINLKEPKRFNLKNGLKVMVVENHKLPRVSIQLLIDNPPILEGEKAGVSSMTASLLGKGSKTIAKDDFEEEVDYIGARISFGSQRAFASSLSQYFPRILELLADAAINPNFTVEEFDKEKAKIITGIKSQEKDANAIANRVQNALSYGTNHPYGEYVTEESVNNIELADVNQFYRNYFVPANAYLVIIGDVNFDEAKELVETHFTPWTKAVPPSFSYSKPTDPYYTQINFVDVPNAVQSEVSVQNLVDLKMADEDYLAALLANRILGGGSQGRLFQNLREDKAYTYHSYSRIDNDRFAQSTFSASASVRNAVTDSTVVQILSEVDKIIKEPVTEQELKDAKAIYIGSFVMALERPETIARYAINLATENLPADFYQNYLENINAVTVEDVQKAAQKYFTSDKARIVVSGKGSDVLENLEKVSFNGKIIPIKYYDKFAKPAEKPVYNAAVPDGITVQSVINNYFKAIGGKEKIENIESLLLIYEGEAMGSKIKTEERRTANKYAQTTFMNDNPMMGIIAKDDELYMKQGANKIPMPAEMASDLKGAMGILPEYGILATGAAKLAGIENINGKSAYKIEVLGTSIQATYYYDIESGLKVKEATVINVGGQTQNQETTMKDYVSFEGILFPSIRSTMMGPQQVESKLLEAVINKNVTDADFE